MAHQLPDQKQNDNKPTPQDANTDPVLHRFSCKTLRFVNISKDTTEAHLWELYGKIAASKIKKIFIYRDYSTNQRLRFGDIHFQSIQDAMWVLQNFKFLNIRGKTVQLMYKTDPILLKQHSLKCKIFVKNLHESIDEPTFYDTFGVFGDILSVRIYHSKYCDRSMGYGWVLFVNQSDALRAMEKVSGMCISDRQIYVSMYLPPHIRNQNKIFTNVFVSNLPLIWTQNELILLLETFCGQISNVMKRDYSANVNFRSYEYAKRAIDTFNGCMLLSNIDNNEFKDLKICQAVKRKELRTKNKKIKKQTFMNRNIIVNMVNNIKQNKINGYSLDDAKNCILFIKNLNRINAENILQKFGEILDIKIFQKRTDVSNKCHVFVLYSNKNAIKAIRCINCNKKQQTKNQIIDDDIPTNPNYQNQLNDDNDDNKGNNDFDMSNTFVFAKLLTDRSTLSIVSHNRIIDFKNDYRY